MQSILQYRRLRASLANNVHPIEAEKTSTEIGTLSEADRSKFNAATPGQRERDSATDAKAKDYDVEAGEPRISRNASSLSGQPTITNDEGESYNIPGIEVRPRKGSQEQEGRDNVFIVGFEDEHDPLNPKNWSTGKKWRAMGVVATTGFIVGWASSIDSAVLQQARQDFGVSEVVESLAGTGIFLIAFGLGSLVAGPMSETVGRNPVYVISLSLFMVFIMASGLAPNIGAQIAFRFLAGFFGCTPLTTFGGSMSDLFYPIQRTYVFTICASLSFLGPFLAPMVGSFIGPSTLVSWRWTEWVTLIICGAITFAIALFVPETYAPVLLKWKAEHLRAITKDDRFIAEIEARQMSFPSRLLQNSYRPIQMFLREIMVTLFTLYLVVVYIVLFGFLVGYDFIFGQVHNFSQIAVGLCFIPMNVGFIVALLICPFIYTQYASRVQQAAQRNQDVQPEQRLWYAMLGALFLPISLFWMAWTTYPQVSYWSPLVASAFFGFSVMGIFISTYQYLIDTYEAYSASALVTATLFRYLAAGVMQVVSLPMYENLGVHWALTLLGCISVLMTPVPYVFYFHGESIRRRFSSTAKN